MMVAPDADVRFLTMLQQVIVMKVKQSTQQAIQGGGGAQPPGAIGGGPGGPPGMAGRPGGPMGLAGAAQQGMQAEPGGPGTAGPGGMPNPDEFRRMVGAGGG